MKSQQLGFDLTALLFNKPHSYVHECSKRSIPESSSGISQFFLSFASPLSFRENYTCPVDLAQLIEPIDYGLGGNPDLVADCSSS